MDESLATLLDDVSSRTGRSRSEIARDALKRQLRIAQFEALRRRVMPLAEARGYLTDDDVFHDV